MQNLILTNKTRFIFPHTLCILWWTMLRAIHWKASGKKTSQFYFGRSFGFLDRRIESNRRKKSEWMVSFYLQEIYNRPMCYVLFFILSAHINARISTSSVILLIWSFFFNLNIPCYFWTHLDFHWAKSIYMQAELVVLFFSLPFKNFWVFCFR